MMSDLPGEMTKQILSAPPRIMRSTRYSLTAHGRSRPPSMRLPTGNSSLENANGWMRLPRPAAGTIPQLISRLRAGQFGRGSTRPGLFEAGDELRGSMIRSVLGERALARRLGDPPHLGSGKCQRGYCVVGVAGDQNLATGIEKAFK